MTASSIDRPDVATTDDDMDAEPCRAVAVAVGEAITEWMKRHTELVRCTVVESDESDGFVLEILDRRGTVWGIHGEQDASLVELAELVRDDQHAAAADMVDMEALERLERHEALVASATATADSDNDNDNDSDNEVEDSE